MQQRRAQKAGLLDHLIGAGELRRRRVEALPSVCNRPGLEQSHAQEPGDIGDALPLPSVWGEVGREAAG
jgi:hypothetical protein